MRFDSSGPAASIGVLIVGGRSPVALTIGECFGFVDLQTSFVLRAIPRAQFPAFLPLPNNPVFSGIVLTAQTFWFTSGRLLAGNALLLGLASR